MDVILSILGLLALNGWQFYFWSRQNKELVDRLMCRNYADYVQSQAIARPPEQKDLQKVPEDLGIEDADILKELNRALPF